MEETRSEQLAQKVTPTVRAKLDEILKRSKFSRAGNFT